MLYLPGRTGNEGVKLGMSRISGANFSAELSDRSAPADIFLRQEPDEEDDEEEDDEEEEDEDGAAEGEENENEDEGYSE